MRTGQTQLKLIENKRAAVYLRKRIEPENKE